MRRRVKRLGWMAGLTLLALSSPSGPRLGGDVTACTDWRTVLDVSLVSQWVSWGNQTYLYNYTCRVKDYRCPRKEDTGVVVPFDGAPIRAVVGNGSREGWRGVG